MTKIKSPCSSVGIIEPEGMRNGSNTNERITSTNSKTGKNEREYSTRVSSPIDAPRFTLVRQNSLSISTTKPVNAVSNVSINALLARVEAFSLRATSQL